MGRMPAIGLVLFAGLATLAGCADDRGTRYSSNTTLPNGQPGQPATAAGQPWGQGNAWSGNQPNQPGSTPASGVQTAGIAPQAPSRFQDQVLINGGTAAPSAAPTTGGPGGASGSRIYDYSLAPTSGQVSADTTTSTPPTGSVRTQSRMSTVDASRVIPPYPPAMPPDVVVPPTGSGRFDASPSGDSTNIVIPPTAPPTPPYPGPYAAPGR